jgi:hypothetical protein
MDKPYARFGERLCCIILGFMIARADQTSQVPDDAIPVYAAIGVLILAARWAVVARRNRRDTARLS